MATYSYSTISSSAIVSRGTATATITAASWPVPTTIAHGVDLGGRPYRQWIASATAGGTDVVVTELGVYGYNAAKARWERLVVPGAPSLFTSVTIPATQTFSVLVENVAYTKLALAAANLSAAASYDFAPISG